MTRAILTVLLLASLPAFSFADDTVCADTFIDGTHDNVIVPAGTVCSSSAHIMGSVKVFGGFNALAGTTIEGNIDGEPGHLFVRLFGLGVVVRGNVQVKNAEPAEPSGYMAGTEIGGNFQAEANSNALLAQGGTIGGDLIVLKNTGGAEIFGNVIQGNLQCSENDPPPTGGGNTVAGNTQGQCADFGDSLATNPIIK
jgi:hypothetical protein